MDTTPTVSLAALRREREAKAAKAAETGLFAEIRKNSRYHGQISGRFPVALFADDEYIVHGAHNRYRLADVKLYWANSSGELFPCGK